MKCAHRVALKPSPGNRRICSTSTPVMHVLRLRSWAVGVSSRHGLEVGEWLNHQSLRPRWNRVKGIIAQVGHAVSCIFP